MDERFKEFDYGERGLDGLRADLPAKTAVEVIAELTRLNIPFTAISSESTLRVKLGEDIQGKTAWEC